MKHMRPSDIVRVATRGLRGHPLRFALSVLGIAIGVASMVAVGGITESSHVQLDQQLAELGTNLLTVLPAEDLNGQQTRLPSTASRMLSNIGPVTATSAVGVLDGVGAYRSPYVPSGQTSSVVVAAVDPSLLATLHGNVDRGRWFTTAGQRYPTVVLGNAAAERLAIDRIGTRIWIENEWCVVVGILRPLPLAGDLDSAVMLPAQEARSYFRYDGTATSIYLRAYESRVPAVSSVIPATANPEHPELVSVERPTDALTAKAAANQTLDRLLIGIAAIGLLVGGVGVSNTMIIASIERRPEIGLRRALGATRGNIGVQFLAESILLSTCGGVVGVLAGYTTTAYYARAQHSGLALPLWVGALAIALTALVGALAGVYPAAKAARSSPVSALATA